MHRGEAYTLSGMVESAQLMVPQREVAIAPFYIGTGALEHLRKRGRLSLQPVLFNRRQPIQRPTGHKQWGAEALGQRMKCFTLSHRPC